MTAVLEPASGGGNLPIPAQPWIPIRYGADTIPAIDALDPAATSTPPRAVCGLPGLMKTMLDMLTALLLLVVLFPVLIALALAVRIDGGPAFFRQTRVGRDGREFTMMKFRSMVVDAEARLGALQTENQGAGPLFKLRHDPRITRVGATLRKYSLDELPQLFNVLTGTMSLIGPRPALPREVATYPTATRRRLAVKPGLTGLWQVSGRSDLSWEESIALDLRYVENWSPLLDATILARTARAVLHGGGAY